MKDLKVINKEQASIELPYPDPLLDPLADRISVIYRTNPDIVDKTLQAYKRQYSLTDDQIIDIKNRVNAIANLRWQGQ